MDASVLLCCSTICGQWRRLHGARGGTCPHFYKWLGTGGTVSRRTTNKKLDKLYWQSRKRSLKQLIVLLDPKSGGARPKKKIFRRFAPDRCSFSYFRSGRVPPLSNSFRRHCLWHRKARTLPISVKLWCRLQPTPATQTTSQQTSLTSRWRNALVVSQ